MVAGSAAPYTHCRTKLGGHWPDSWRGAQILFPHFGDHRSTGDLTVNPSGATEKSSKRGRVDIPWERIGQFAGELSRYSSLSGYWSGLWQLLATTTTSRGTCEGSTTGEGPTA